MYVGTDGIVLRQTKIVRGRRMLLVFSKKFGKISAGSNINEKGRSRSALAVRPFTLGRYDLYKKGTFFSINGAETLRSFYSIGEDVDKYMHASYGLELVEKMTEEGEPAVTLFNLTVDFLREMEGRRKKFLTLTSAYEIKAFQSLGYLPVLNRCVSCGSKEEPVAFSIKDGGVLCKACYPERKVEGDREETLIYQVDFDIVNVLNYFLDHPLEDLKTLALDDKKQRQISEMLKGYRGYHIDVGTLKSEDCIMQY